MVQRGHKELYLVIIQTPRVAFGSSGLGLSCKNIRSEAVAARARGLDSLRVQSLGPRVGIRFSSVAFKSLGFRSLGFLNPKPQKVRV